MVKMRSCTQSLWIFFFLPLILFLAGPSAFAETMEMVTYYPTSSNSGNQHVNSLTVGTAYQGTTPADGTAIISGLLGIGTTNPGTNLTVHRNDVLDTPAIKIEQAGTGDAALWFEIGTGNQWIVGADNSDADKFKISRGGSLGDNDKLTIDTAGNVGIGTNTPAERLSVFTPGGTTPVQAMGIDVNTFSTAANSQASYFFRVRDIGVGSTPFFIRGDGNVGIGTATPGARLEVQGSVKIADGTQGTGKVLISDADGLASWKTTDVTVVKTETETRTSTALAADAALQFQIGADQLWQFEIVVLCNVGDGNMKWGLNGPAAVWLRAGSEFLSSRLPDKETGSYLCGLQTSYGTTFTSLFSGQWNRVLRIAGSVQNGPAAGTFAFQWAKNSAQGTTQIYRGSYLKAARIS